MTSKVAVLVEVGQVLNEMRLESPGPFGEILMEFRCLICTTTTTRWTSVDEKNQFKLVAGDYYHGFVSLGGGKHYAPLACWNCTAHLNWLRNAEDTLRWVNIKPFIIALQDALSPLPIPIREEIFHHLSPGKWGDVY